MQPDVTVGGLVVPGYAVAAIAAIASAIWAWASSRRIKSYESTLRQRELAIESRFSQQNEAFRLAHSPRVSGAVKLWAAFCEFERCLRAQLSPMRVYTIPKDTAREEADRVKEELRLKQERSIREATAAAWGSLKVARDEAEVLLPGPVFAKFDKLFRCFYDAHGEQWVAELAGEPGRTVNSLRRASRSPSC